MGIKPRIVYPFLLQHCKLYVFKAVFWTICIKILFDTIRSAFFDCEIRLVGNLAGPSNQYDHHHHRHHHHHHLRQFKQINLRIVQINLRIVQINLRIVQLI